MKYWELISKEDNPEEWARMEKGIKKVRECEKRGHGQLFVDVEGYLFCPDCGQCLLVGPGDGADDCEDD